MKKITFLSILVVAMLFVGMVLYIVLSEKVESNSVVTLHTSLINKRVTTCPNINQSISFQMESGAVMSHHKSPQGYGKSKNRVYSRVSTQHSFSVLKTKEVPPMYTTSFIEMCSTGSATPIKQTDAHFFNRTQFIVDNSMSSSLESQALSNSLMMQKAAPPTGVDLGTMDDPYLPLEDEWIVLGLLLVIVSFYKWKQ